MKRLLAIVAIASINVAGFAQGTNAMSMQDVMRDVDSKIGKISGFSATVETSETGENGAGEGSTSQLQVSKLYGWKLTSKEGPQPFTIVTDYQTFYQYFPNDNRVIKMTADRPEIKAMLLKPITDMNPLHLLASASMQYLGQEEFEGETVYHVEGTTESQLMPGGPEVRRTLSAWISVQDGLPRKTVESVGISTGTTVYRDVKINPDLTPANFKFTPPPAAMVIDRNQQMRQMQQQMQRPSARTSGSVPR